MNHPITPTAGKALSASIQFTGSVLGGNVNQIEPVIDAKYFRRGFGKTHVIGLHFSGRYITGFGGKTAAPFNRFYIGGENDVRGFDFFAITPIAFVPIEASVPLLNNDGTPRQQLTINSSGFPVFVAATKAVPSYQLVTPGGDTALVANVEYRVPIFGPVTLAAFFDAGLNRLLNTSQLDINPERIAAIKCRIPERQFPRQSGDCARDAANSCIHRTGIAGLDAGSERAFPGLFRLQPMDCKSVCSAADRDGPQFLPQPSVIPERIGASGKCLSLYRKTHFVPLHSGPDVLSG